VFHSERGFEVVVRDFRSLLAQIEAIPEYEKQGCWDNAVPESFLSTLEPVHRDLAHGPGRRAALFSTKAYDKSASQYTPRQVRGISTASRGRQPEACSFRRAAHPGRARGLRGRCQGAGHHRWWSSSSAIGLRHHRSGWGPSRIGCCCETGVVSSPPRSDEKAISGYTVVLAS